MKDQSNTNAADHLREEREFFRRELLKQAGSRKGDVVLERLEIRPAPHHRQDTGKAVRLTAELSLHDYTALVVGARIHGRTPEAMLTRYLEANLHKWSDHGFPLDE